MPPLPLVSTIIPAFNRAKDLPIALESALGQTYPSDRQEIIVVDDGSTDDTADVVARYGARVRYLKKQNGGVSSARNVGIRAAQGELIALLDSDDRWRPSKLEKQVALLQSRSDLGLVVTDVAMMDENRRQTGEWRRRSGLPHDGHALRYVVKNPALSPSTTVVRKSVLDDVGLFDELLSSAEDIDIHLRIARKYGVGLVPEVLMEYTRGLDGLSADVSTYATYLFVMERFHDEHRDELAESDWHEALTAAYVRNARGLVFNGRYAFGARVAGRAALHTRSRSEALAVLGVGVVLGRRVASRAIKRVLGRR